MDFEVLNSFFMLPALRRRGAGQTSLRALRIRYPSCYGAHKKSEVCMKTKRVKRGDTRRTQREAAIGLIDGGAAVSTAD